MLLFADAPAWVTDYPISAVILGLILLVVGAEVLVRGAVWIALTVGMSPMAVGLTLVSIGTSLPELLVTLTAADGKADIGVGNVLGSNVANVLLIVGASAAIRAFQLKARWFELGYMLVLTALACLPFICGGELTRWMSGIMLAVLVLFLIQLLARERASVKLVDEPAREVPTFMCWLTNTLYVMGGFVALKFGADWLVHGSSEIAANLGMTEAQVGVTVVAIGTSMPELATSVIAAMRGHPELCIGNVVGSNIFNIGAVLGAAGLLHPFTFAAPEFMVTLALTIISSIALTVILRKANGVPRSAGWVFLVAFVAFIGYSLWTKTPPQ